MTGYTLSGEARNDLFELWDYLAQFSIRAADEAVALAEEAFSRIAAHPEMGHLRPDLTSGPYRILTSEEMTIIYRSDRHQPMILRVSGKGRNLASLLGAL
jgi:plasmid stabilization system protein ParE